MSFYRAELGTVVGSSSRIHGARARASGGRKTRICQNDRSVSLVVWYVVACRRFSVERWVGWGGVGSGRVGSVWVVVSLLS